MKSRKWPVVLVMILTLLVPPGAAFGQEQTAPQSASVAAPVSAPARTVPLNLYQYSKARLWFPASIKPYTQRYVPPPVLTNTPRIESLIHEGKLTLSLDDAISLALENNLGIAVQRYTTWFAGTDLLRAEAGQSLLGTSGFVPVLGSFVAPSFDPVVSSTLSWTRSSFPVNNPFTSGVGVTRVASLINYSTVANFQYTQGFHTGTSFTVGWDNTRSSTSSPVVFFNPAVQSQFFVSFQQPLLNGFGLLPNTRFIIEAKNNLQAANYAFQQQVINTVALVEHDYWELVFALENVKVQQQALVVANQLYQDNKRQVAIGTMAPLEVVQAEAQVASSQQAVIVAETGRLQQQTVLLNDITKNPMAPGLQDVEVVPTDSASVLPKVEVIPLQDAVREAWQKRPDLLESELSLKNTQVEVKATRNALLPGLTLFGQYAGTGLGGNQTVKLPNGTTTVIPGGLADALNAAYNGSFPTYAAGVTLSIPLRNRSAEAANARALLEERQAEVSYRQLQNTIVVNVRNAQIAMQQGLASVKAAQQATIYARETLEAERKKLALGVSTTFQVVQDLGILLTDEGNELRAKVSLQEARVTYDQALGRTLEVEHVTIADARGGHVYRPPLIPGTPDLFTAGRE